MQPRPTSISTRKGRNSQSTCFPVPRPRAVSTRHSSRERREKRGLVLMAQSMRNRVPMPQK